MSLIESVKKYVPFAEKPPELPNIHFERTGNHYLVSTDDMAPTPTHLRTEQASAEWFESRATKRLIINSVTALTGIFSLGWGMIGRGDRFIKTGQILTGAVLTYFSLRKMEDSVNDIRLAQHILEAVESTQRGQKS